MSSYTALQARRLTAAMAGHEVGSEVQVHSELASTNDHVRDLGLQGYPHGLVVFAESQTAGRGRRENRWVSDPGQDLLLSVLLRPSVPVELWPRATTLAALAICRAVEGVTGLSAAIKWPNDVCLGDRKCAGILAESFAGSAGTFMVLGVGLNVNTSIYPPELRDIATSLKLELGGAAPVDRNTLAIGLMKQLDHLLLRWEAGFSHVVAEVRQRSWLLGKRLSARVNGSEVQGVAAGLDEEGCLLLLQDDGVQITLTSAEQVRPAGG